MSTPLIAAPPDLSSDGLQRRLREAGYRVVGTPLIGARDWTDAEVSALFESADAIVAHPSQRFPASLLRRAPRLRLICSSVIGVDHIDVAEASELGILVANCPTEENVVGVAEATVMLMAALVLELERKQAALRAGRWRPPTTAGILKGRTVGLVGYGRIAHCVEARLQGWDVTIRVSDPYVPGTVSLDELLRVVDVLSLHVVLTPETRWLIGRRELGLMKPSAIVVNTSRGGIIDEAALAEAIDARRIAGAAIDVFELEPVDPRNPLLRCDPERVILTPHAVGHNVETLPAAASMAFDAVERALRGQVPENAVNRGSISRWTQRVGSFEVARGTEESRLG